MKKILFALYLLMSFGYLCACAGSVDSDALLQLENSDGSIDTSEISTEFSTLPAPTPEQFGLTGEYAELFQAVTEQDNGSWSLSIPQIIIRGTKILSDRQTMYYCSVILTMYDVRETEIVDTCSRTYDVFITLSTSDQKNYSWIAFAEVIPQNQLSLLERLGMDDLADQLKAGESLPIVWEMPEGDELLSEYCNSIGITLNQS